jgi:microcystin-dependent protein
MPFDWSEYESDSATEEVALLLSVKSQSLILSAMQSLQFRSNWLEIDDSTYDDIEAAVAEAYEEIMRVSMPDFTPVGTIVSYIGTRSSVPSKWELCEGQPLDIGDYPELAAIVHPSWVVGSDIILPLLSERFIYGAETDTDLGDTGGAATHTLTTAELPPHAHGVLYAAGTGGNTTRMAVGNNTGTGTTPSANAGSGSSHNNMPPYLRAYWIIKVLP